jgi:pterin-4a-carbinolamine dehydratase/uncharacterized protein (DUF2267 family)
MMMQYRELVTAVARRIGVSTEEARDAADATIDTLARTLGESQRQRLFERVPAVITQENTAVGAAPNADAFVAEVSWLTGIERDQARYRTQAVLSTVAQYEPELLGELRVPDALRELFADPVPGGGVTSGHGHAAPLTDEEVAEALDDLPYWSGNRCALRRTLVLPPGNLEAVLTLIGMLKQDHGRSPHVERDGADTAVLILFTNSVGAVTALDVDLAHRVDAVIDRAGAGIDAEPG